MLVFNDALTAAYLLVSDGNMIMNNEFGKMWQEIIVASFNILWGKYPLLGYDSETEIEKIAVARQRPERQWTDWKAVFSVQSTSMAEHVTMNTATEELCFLCRPWLDILSRTVS
jgi:hypothetical protein